MRYFILCSILLAGCGWEERDALKNEVSRLHDHIQRMSREMEETKRNLPSEESANVRLIKEQQAKINELNTQLAAAKASAQESAVIPPLAPLQVELKSLQAQIASLNNRLEQERNERRQNDDKLRREISSKHAREAAKKLLDDLSEID
jgi:hypothetical protein